MATVSIKCPKCNGDLWEVTGDTAECTNCFYERPYHRRNGNSGKMTPSQKRKIKHIRNWFKRYFRKDDLARFEAKYQNETGLVYLSVETDENYLIMDGAFFCIGRKGGVKILNTMGLSNVHNEQFYAKFLGGKVGW